MTIIYTLFAILAFSFWTPTAAFTLQKINVWEFIFWTEAVTFISSWFFLKWMLKRNPIKYTRFKELSGKEKRIFALSGLCRILAVGCIFTSFTYLSVAVAISVYDFWPILAIYLTPILISKDWSKVKTREIIFSLLAIGGVFMLFAPEMQGNLFNSTTPAWKSWGLLLLPLIAGIFQASGEIIKGDLIEKCQVNSHPFISIFSVNVTFGGFCLLFSTIALVLSRLFLDLPISVYTPDVILAIFFFSIVVITFGRMSLSRALSMTSENIFTLWFFLPIFTLLWLWLFDIAPITSEVILGTSMITISNLLISSRPDNNVAYPAAVLSLVLASLYCYYFEGYGINDYFEGVSTPLIFFVLIVAFLMDRLVQRDRIEETLVIEMIHHIENDGPKDIKKKKGLIDQLSSIIKTNDTQKISSTYQKLRNAKHKCLKPVISKLDILVLSRIQGTSFGEILVLSMLGALVIITAIVFRPIGIFGDCFGIVLSASVCFIYFTVLDLIMMRATFFLEMDEKGKFLLSKDIPRTTSLDLMASITLILVVIFAMMGALLYK